MSIPSYETSIPALSSMTRSGDSSSRMGLVLLMWIKNFFWFFFGFFQGLQHSHNAVFPRLVEMAHLAGQFVADPFIGHFIIGPDCPIHQYAVRVFHIIHDMVFNHAQSRGIKQVFAGVQILYTEPDIITGNGIMPVW